jgi:hypothetical protein
LPPNPDGAVVTFDGFVAFEGVVTMLKFPGGGVVVVVVSSVVWSPGGGVVVVVVSSVVWSPGGGVVIIPPVDEFPNGGIGVVSFCPATCGAASANAKSKTTPRNSLRSLIAVPNQRAGPCELRL